MDLRTFIDEYDNLSVGRRREALYNLIDLLTEDNANLVDTFGIDALLDICCDLEADDHFGTEGASL